jgi:hypothetical protein
MSTTDLYSATAILRMFPHINSLFLEGCMCAQLHGPRLGPHRRDHFQVSTNPFKLTDNWSP